MAKKKYDAKMGFWCYTTEREVIEHAAKTLGVSASSFIRSAVLAQALAMEDHKIREFEGLRDEDKIGCLDRENAPVQGL